MPWGERLRSVRAGEPARRRTPRREVRRLPLSGRESPLRHERIRLGRLPKCPDSYFAHGANFSGSASVATPPRKTRLSILPLRPGAAAWHSHVATASPERSRHAPNSSDVPSGGLYFDNPGRDRGRNILRDREGSESDALSFRALPSKPPMCCSRRAERSASVDIDVVARRSVTTTVSTADRDYDRRIEYKCMCVYIYIYIYICGII